MYFTDINFVNGASFVTDWTSAAIQDSSMAYDSRNNDSENQCNHGAIFINENFVLQKISHCK